MKIANIIISTPLKVNKKFNVVDSYDKRIIGIPTLIVGLDNVRKVEPNPDFLDRKLNDNLFWTFTKKEKRVLFEEDLYYFSETVYKKIIKKTSYIFIDLILLDKNKIINLFTDIQNISKKITLLYRDMLYVYGDDKIFGFDLKQVTYIGKDKSTLINKIKGISDVFLDDEHILIEYNNDLEMFNYETKYIPLLYTINNYE